MTLTDAIGPFDSRPARPPAGYPTADELASGAYAAADYAVIAKHLLLVDALVDSGVETLSFDAATLLHLANESPAVVRVVAGWIVRAHLEGLAYGGDDDRREHLQDVWSAR